MKAAQVLSAHAARTSEGVSLHVITERGRAEMLMTPALARQFGTDLVTRAEETTRPHAQTGGRAPFYKPSGGL